MAKFGLALIAILSIMGCSWCTTSTDISEVKPGMLGRSLRSLHLAYDQVEEMKHADPKGKRTQEFIERQTGIVFNSSNVELVPGPAAFQRIFGSTVFQGALIDPKNTVTLLDTAAQFKAYFITFKDITTYTDRYYFTTKETIKQGDNLVVVFMFKKDAVTGEDVLFYNDYNYVKVDTKESVSAFAQGVIDVLKEYLGPASALNDLYNKVKSTVKPAAAATP